MAKNRRGLGRGLASLIPEPAEQEVVSRPAHNAAEATGTDGQRPTDLFFAGSSETSEIVTSLLAPAPRRDRGSRKKSVSRETVTGGTLSLASEAAASNDDATAATEGAQPVELVDVPGTSFAEIPVDAIVPNRRQPRTHFDQAEIAELSASIKEVGLLQPIVVRPWPESEPLPDGVSRETVPGGRAYELVMGERRLRASREAGLETIPAIVRTTADDDLLRDALLENLHRVQLNPLEEAAAYQQLLDDFGCTQSELAERIARSRSQIANTLRLMKLPPSVQNQLTDGSLSAGHARALLGLPHAEAMEKLAERIVNEGLSVRNTEEQVALQVDAAEAGETKVKARNRAVLNRELSTKLSGIFDARVKVTQGAKKGKIVIEFSGGEDLERIVGSLTSASKN